MRVAVIVFPGSNCDRDLAVAFRRAGADVSMVWHKESSLPDRVDMVAIPGGFSFGDYLRSGAIAARSPISQAIERHAVRGGYVLGICNGFQVLTEIGLLPGALMRNYNMKFVCKDVDLKVENNRSDFTSSYVKDQSVRYPVAHHDGNYTADAETLKQLNAEGQVAFRYLNNPNGSAQDIAGILSENNRVLGMMPHPERVVDPALGGDDGALLFSALTGAMTSA